MDLLSIIIQFFQQIFSMFNQMVGYLITAPGSALYDIMTQWGHSFEAYVLLIPIVFVTVLGITGILVYTFIEMNQGIDEGMNVTNLIGEV